jgi:glycosyltransferase involved in cell wall biosynthesis
MKIIVSCSGKFHAFNLVEELLNYGHDVLFFTSYASNKNIYLKHFVRRKDKEKIDVKFIKTNLCVAFALKIFPKHSQLVNNYFDKWVSKKIINYSADIFIGWSSMSEHSLMAAKRNGMKTILERGSAHILVQDILLKNEYKSIGKKFKISERTINKELIEYQISDYISIPSRFVLNTFLQNHIPNSKLFINPYGVSNHFEPVLFSNSKVTTFLYLGKLSIQKGAHILFTILEELISKKFNFKFLFIGESENEINNLLKRKLLTSDNIKFLGHINHYELNKYIGECDVAIVPSIQDGFAMVASQILKVGLPIIISENAGAEQLIIEGNNGWVVKPNSIEIQKRVEWCIFNLENIKAMRLDILKNNCYKELTWNDYANRYINFLNRINE